MNLEIIYMLYVYFWVAIMGTCIGSFLNVVIHRLPKNTFFAESRSHCPGCGKTLKWKDILPIISYILLKGRCRYCGMRISPKYPLVELTCALLAALCLARFGLGLSFVISFGVSAILLAITVIDLEIMEIPNILTLALVPFAVFAMWAFNEVTIVERVLGIFTVSLPMLVLTLVIHGAFGGGDIKLMAVCGFLLGWKSTLLAFFVALIIGGAYATFLLLTGGKKRGEHIAFGPYLSLGVVVALLWGTEIIRFYFSTFYLTFYM